MDYSHPNQRRFDLQKRRPEGDVEREKDHDIDVEEDSSGKFEAWINGEGELPELPEAPKPEMGEQPRMEKPEEELDPVKQAEWLRKNRPPERLPRGHEYLN